MRASAFIPTGIIIGTLLSSVACSSLLSTGSNEPQFGTNEVAGSKFEGDVELHRQNAISFYDAGDFYRSRDQFQKIIAAEPANANAKGGYAFCSYFIGLNEVALGNFNGGAKNLILAERTFEAVYDGKLPKSTTEGTGREWRNALGLAMTWRALGSLDKMRSDDIDRVLGEGRSRNSKALLEEQQKRDLRRRDTNQNALGLFRRLAAMQYAAPDAILNQGDMELIVGNNRASLTAYERYLSIARKNINNWDRRLEEWPEQFQSEKYSLEAQKAINGKRSAAVTKTIVVLTQVAKIHFGNRNYADSLTLLSEAATLDPARADLNVPIAECYERLGESELALKHIDAFIRSNVEIDEDTRRAYRLRARILNKSGG